LADDVSFAVVFTSSHMIQEQLR